MATQSGATECLFSIITVVKNDANGIRSTIESIIQQQGCSFEYIVIDGCSNDGTQDIIHEYSEHIDKSVFSKDNGVYDAMNKSLKHANGKWILFMNSGDTFYANDILKKTSLHAGHRYSSILYGNCFIKPRNKPETNWRYVPASSLKKMYKGPCFSHQSAFIPLDYQLNNPYDTSLSIAADFKFFYNALKRDSLNFIHLDFPVSVLSSGGLSDINQVKSVYQWYQSVDHDLKCQWHYCVLLAKTFAKQMIKKTIGYHS